MSSGARCEEALPGTALGGIAMSILTFYYGKRKAKFSKKVGSYQKLQNIGGSSSTCVFKWGRQSSPVLAASKEEDEGLR
jgi:hypothetical protein